MDQTTFPKFNLRLSLATFFFLAALLGMTTMVKAAPVAQDPPPTPESTPLPGFPVTLGGKTLFYVYQRIGPLTPAERAALIQQKIQQVAGDPFAPPVQITLAESDQGIDLITGDTILLTVTQADAQAVGLSREEAAQAAARLIQEHIEEYRLLNTPQARANRFLTTMVLLLVLFVPLFFLNRMIQRRLDRIEQATATSEGNEVHDATGFYRTRLWMRLIRLLYNAVRVALVLVLLFIVSPYVLQLFPSTASYARPITAFLTGVLSSAWSWLADHWDELLTIVVIILITHGLTRLVRAFFVEVEQGTIRFARFDPEWAPFTRRILNFLLIVGAIMIAFPYVPGSDSEAFRGISVFLGLLFTLSSTAAVANIVSGVIQTYTGAFRLGDVVRMGDTTGIVIEKSLLTTRLRTFKKEDVSIPNSLVMNAQVVNYSVQARTTGLVLYTTVTIGYDVPWRKVHELLLCAAANTPGLVSDPAPFILQTSLNDYHVSYQLNAYTKQPEIMAQLYAQMHQNIQDEFNQAGVEIMSPAFTSLRDGNTITIPPENRPPHYQPPGFLVDGNR